MSKTKYLITLFLATLMAPLAMAAVPTGTISNLSISPLNWNRNNGNLNINLDTTYSGTSSAQLKLSVYKYGVGDQIVIYNGPANNHNSISFTGVIPSSGEKLGYGDYFLLAELVDPVSGNLAAELKDSKIIVTGTPSVTAFTLSKTSYDSSVNGNLTVNFNADTGGLDLAGAVIVYDKTKTQTLWYQSVDKVKSSNTVTWSGTDSNGQKLTAGDYKVVVKLFKPKSLIDSYDEKSLDLKVTSTQTVTTPPSILTPINPTANPGSSTSGSQSTSNSSNTSNSTSSSDPAKSQSTNKVLLPSPDILTCKARANKLYFENDAPAYDWMGVDCLLNLQAKIKVGIYNKNYDVKAADNSGNLIRTIQNGQLYTAGKLYFSWNGYDDYDQGVALDDYVFVVEAKPGENYTSDISLQKFTVINVSEKVDATDTNALTPASDASSAEESASAENVDNLRGAAPETSQPSVIENVANAIFGDKSASAEVSANREVSKCPGVYYPTDIEKSTYKDTIKAAYDRCLVRGYEDGTFKPEQSLSRAEAAKIIVLGTGNIAKVGCYDADCGSPFADLDMWQGPWIRSAYDLKMVAGVGMNKFAPNRQITRAEAVALITKSFKILPYQGCYTSNCGAGHPNDFFKDIIHDWQGQYLRAAWDKKLITTIEPGKFYPDVPVSRGVFLDWAMKLVK